MKARILYNYPIFNSLSDTDICHKDEIVTIIGQSDGSDTLNTGGIAFCCVFDDGSIANIQDSWLQIIPGELVESEIDWEKRRYELARAAMQGIISNHDWAKSANIADDFDEYKERVSEASMEISDLMILKLKKL